MKGVYLPQRPSRAERILARIRLVAELVLIVIGAGTIAVLSYLTGKWGLL
jgi:hypothetical protein